MNAPTLTEQQYFLLGLIQKGILIKTEDNGVSYKTQIKRPLAPEEYIIDLERE